MRVRPRPSSVGPRVIVLSSMNDGNGWLNATEPGMSRQRTQTKAAGAIACADLTGLRFFTSTSCAGLGRCLMAVQYRPFSETVKRSGIDPGIDPRLGAWPMGASGRWHRASTLSRRRRRKFKPRPSERSSPPGRRKQPQNKQAQPLVRDVQIRGIPCVKRNETGLGPYLADLRKLGLT